MAKRPLGYASLFVGLLFVGCVGDAATPASALDGSVADTSTADQKIVDAPINDSSADAADASMAWSPAQLQGLALWLDGDKVAGKSGDPVTTWPDQSSNHSDATATAKAVLITGVGGINGHNTLHFAGSSVYTITDRASLRWTGPFVIAFVVRGVTAGSLYSKKVADINGTNHGPSVFFSTGTTAAQGKFYLFTNSTVDLHVVTTTDVDPSAHRVISAFDGVSTMTLQIDRGTPVTKTQAGATALDAMGADATIGNFVDATKPLTGDIAEIVAASSPMLGQTDINNIGGYLDAKYALK